MEMTMRWYGKEYDTVTLQQIRQSCYVKGIISTLYNKMPGEVWELDEILALKKDVEDGKINCIVACGPLPMLKAVRNYAIEKNIPCQISLEEKMGCGLGVCLGCAVKTAESSSEKPEYVHVCKAGPVFEAKDVEI